MSELVPYHMFDRFMRTAQRYEESWRKDNQLCFEYVDGDQWTDFEKSSIESRGQQPTVINTILPTVDMVCSVAEQQRCDIQVVGREGSDENMAQLLTELLKHVADDSHEEYHIQQGFRDAIIGGRAWFEVGIKTDERGKDIVKIEHLPWEDVYLDPFSRKPDASDARFIIKTKWLDRDVVKKLYPDAEQMIDTTFNDDYKGQEYEAQMNSQGRGEALYFDPKSNRIRICECYYTMPENRKVKVLDEKTGKYHEKEVFINAVHYVAFSDQVILDGSATNHAVNKNPLGLDLYPFVPMYCRRDRKGKPQGIVKSLVDIQDQINKLNSKFLWTLMANRLVMEVGASDDLDRVREEYQKPDGLVLLNEGGLSKVKVDEKYRDLSYMSQHLSFLMQTEQRISGVNDSMLGLGGSNERSGTMQATRISQGAAMQTTILQNMLYCRERIAYLVLRLIGKYYTDYRIMRVTRPNGDIENYEFNVKQTIINPETGEEEVNMLAPIEDTLYYDVILKRVAPFTSQRERMLQIFSEVLKSGVIPAEIAGKLMIELSDIPNKSDLLKEMEGVQEQNQMNAQQIAQQQMAIDAAKAGVDVNSI